MRFSHLLAVAVVVGAAGWILSGNLGDEVPAAETVTVAQQEEEPAVLTRVRVSVSRAEDYSLELTLTGQTAAERVVAVRAQTYGRVESVEVEPGDFVEAGTVIARLAPDDRLERLERAKASVRQYEIEYEASSELAEGGWRTEAAVAQALASLQRARAELATIRMDIGRTRIVAPISGMLETLDVEAGEIVFTGAGNALGEIVDLDPVTVVAHISEARVKTLRTGDEGTVTTVTGETAPAILRFIASTADPQTRTFRVELDVANPGHRIRAGMTASVRLPLETIPSHLIPPSILSLADDGTLGVKIVDDGDRVRFVAVEIVAAGAGGYHVAGLPGTVTLITVGQEFVVDGETVIPVHADGSADPAAS